jgi:hypothetical protein
VALRKREGTGKRKRTRWFIFSEEHVLEEAMDVLQDRTRDGGGNYDGDGNDEEEEDDIISNINRHTFVMNNL